MNNCPGKAEQYTKAGSFFEFTFAKLIYLIFWFIICFCFRFLIMGSVTIRIWKFHAEFTTDFFRGFSLFRIPLVHWYCPRPRSQFHQNQRLLLPTQHQLISKIKDENIFLLQITHFIYNVCLENGSEYFRFQSSEATKVSITKILLGHNKDIIHFWHCSRYPLLLLLFHYK